MSTAVIGYMPMPVNFEYRSLFLHGRPKHEKFDDFWRKHPPMDRHLTLLPDLTDGSPVKK